MNRILSAFLLLALSMAVTVGCARRTVERIDPNRTTDLSGRWNETDAKLVSAEMIKDALARPWYELFQQRKSRKPVIVIGFVTNKTTEHIDVEVFIKEMEKEFINRNAVRVVQAGEQRDRMREERADQQKYASEETRKQWARELGADYILSGNMSSVTDEYRKERAVFYKINLELVDLETNEKVWIGDKEIKKFITN